MAWLPLAAEIALLWLAVEICFLILVRCVWLPRLRKLTPPDEPQLRPREMIRRIVGAIDSIPGLTIQQYIIKWFPGADHQAWPLRGNVVELLAWAMFTKEPRSLSMDESLDIDGAIADTEERFGCKFDPGRDNELKPVRFTLEEDLHVLHRPLLFYIIIFLLHLVGNVVMAVRGFRIHRTTESIIYWHRVGSHEKVQGEKCSPIIFFHGLGTGPLVSLPLVWSLCSKGKRDVIVVEQPWLSMRLDFRVPSREAFVTSIGEILRRHSWNGTAHIVGHSYGSVPAAWICLHMPEIVASLVLLDPVTVLLAEPTVVNNILYNHGSTLIGRIIYLVVGSEIGIAYTLRRHFHWYNQCLFASDLDRIRCSLVVLAENDHIVPSSMVRQYLHASSATSDVMWLPGFRHGQLLFSRCIRNQIGAWLDRQEDLRSPSDSLTKYSSDPCSAGASSQARQPLLSVADAGSSRVEVLDRLFS